MNELEQLKRRVADLEYRLARIDRGDYILLDRDTKHTGSKLGFFNKAPAAQQATIDDPSGGVTIDANARTAINSILDVLDVFGLTA